MKRKNEEQRGLMEELEMANKVAWGGGRGWECVM